MKKKDFKRKAIECESLWAMVEETHSVSDRRVKDRDLHTAVTISMMCRSANQKATFLFNILSPFSYLKGVTGSTNEVYQKFQMTLCTRSINNTVNTLAKTFGSRKPKCFLNYFTFMLDDYAKAPIFKQMQTSGNVSNAFQLMVIVSNGFPGIEPIACVNPPRNPSNHTS